MRLPYIDALKGFLILLVIWGHVVQFASDDFFGTITFRTLYCFHMAIFFFVSGYLLSIGRHGVRFLPKKLLRLLLPYVTWYFAIVFALAPERLLEEMSGLFTHSGMGLWFLLTLAECMVVCVFSESFAPVRFHRLWLVVIGIMCVSVAFLLRDIAFDIRHFAKYYQYFLGGYLFARCDKFLASPKDYGKRFLLVGALSVFVLGLVVAALVEMKGMVFQTYKVVVSWSGCIGLFWLFGLSSWNSIAGRHLVRLGHMTLGLYAIHVFVLAAVWPRLPAMPLVVSFVALLMCSVVSMILLKKIPFLACLFLGMFKRSTGSNQPGD